MQHEMQNRIARLEGSDPIAFESGSTMRRLRLVICLHLRARDGRENR